MIPAPTPLISILLPYTTLQWSTLLLQYASFKGILHTLEKVTEVKSKTRVLQYKGEVVCKVEVALLDLRLSL